MNLPRPTVTPCQRSNHIFSGSFLGHRLLFRRNCFYLDYSLSISVEASTLWRGLPVDKVAARCCVA